MSPFHILVSDSSLHIWQDDLLMEMHKQIGKDRSKVRSDVSGAHNYPEAVINLYMSS